MNMKPIKLHGNWTEGYALDKYITFSKPIKDDEGNIIKFENTYSDLGKAIHDLKYASDLSVIPKIVEKATEFINETWNNGEIDAIICSPPSKQRRSQPVFQITKGIGETLDIKYTTELFKKTNKNKVRDIPVDEREEHLEKYVKQTKKLNSPYNFLIIDDLYESGSTLKTITKKLKEYCQDTFNSNINVYILSITKNKNS